MKDGKSPSVPPVLCLMGPTGAGKSALALALAGELPCEVVNVDSAQVYRGLDVGSAKPDPAERRRVPHHLLDLCDPTESYSAARFRADALAVIADIQARGRWPLLVGGTGLYFRALAEGLATLPPPDPVLRAGLRAELAEQGSAALHARLAEVDPLAAQRIHPNDPQRILRALEIHAQVGRPLSEMQREAGVTPPPFRLVPWIIAPATRALLHARLARRFHQMLERGLVNEVMGLRARADLGPDRPALRAVGYRAVWRYLEGELAHSAMVGEAIIATRQLAKRQYTWFRGVAGAVWWDSEAADLGVRARQGLIEIMRHEPRGG